jgi:cytidylate kinase
MYRQIAAVHPLLAEGMRFVDMNDYALERLDAERRLDEKQRKLTEEQQVNE